MKRKPVIANNLLVDVLLSTSVFAFLVSAVVFASLFATGSPPKVEALAAPCKDCVKRVSLMMNDAARVGLATKPATAPEPEPEPEPLPVVDPQEARRTLEAAARKYFPSDAKELPSKRIFRLTRDQLDISVAALLPDYVTQSIKSEMNRDPLQTNYEYAELLGFNSANIGSLSKWISAIAARVRKRPAGLINCAASRNSRKCLDAQARKFILKAFRGDVSRKRVDRIAKFYLTGVAKGGFAQGTSELVEVVLNSPDFLFRKELDTDDNGRLTPGQLLQALTYTMADAPPAKLDLLTSQARQHLAAGDSRDATINAIVTSPAARAKLLRFFKAWLEIKQPGDFRISKQVFPKFTPQLASAMLNETNHFLQTQLAKPSPSLKDITQSTRTFISKPMAEIYGLQLGKRSMGQLVSHDRNQRLGIFSQPALLASHSGPTDTRLIKRGVFWARKVMCMDLQPPPPGLDSSLIKMGHTTERSRVERSTRRKACAGCHNIINPFGFFQESYDALGRWRLRDNGFPIDTSIAFNFLDEGPGSSVKPVDALRTFTNSVKFKQCFVRQLFRFYMGRGETPSDDPLLRRMFFEFAENDEQDIMKLIKTLASSQRIASRR